MIRNVAGEMIASLGHDVVSAEDGRKAIELFNAAREAGTSSPSVTEISW